MAKQLTSVPQVDRRRYAFKSAALLVAFVCSLFANHSVAIGQDTTLSSKLSSVAPETCVSWYQWANPFNADAASPNSVDRMMVRTGKFSKTC